MTSAKICAQQYIIAARAHTFQRSNNIPALVFACENLRLLMIIRTLMACITRQVLLRQPFQNNSFLHQPSRWSVPPFLRAYVDSVVHREVTLKNL